MPLQLLCHLIYVIQIIWIHQQHVSQRLRKDRLYMIRQFFSSCRLFVTYFAGFSFGRSEFVAFGADGFIAGDHSFIIWEVFVVKCCALVDFAGHWSLFTRSRNKIRWENTMQHPYNENESVPSYGASSQSQAYCATPSTKMKVCQATEQQPVTGKELQIQFIQIECYSLPWCNLQINSARWSSGTHTNFWMMSMTLSYQTFHLYGRNSRTPGRLNSKLRLSLPRRWQTTDQ